MLRFSLLCRLVALAALFSAVHLMRRQYLFKQYLNSRQITSNDFPPSYIQALNESVANGQEPPLDFDYASTFTAPKIPRMIHFIWFQNLYPTHDGGSQIPASISHAPERCRLFNKDFEIKVWNATSAQDFLETEYAWFMPTYDGYRYPIQRIDALKYFALYHYGGVYMDLDIACRRPLEPLLEFPAWFPEAAPLGVNNDLMAARAGHPILELMVRELERRDRNWVFPYLTIMFSTGPFFASVVLKKWVGSGGRDFTGGLNADPNAFFVLPEIYYSEKYTFFGHSPGDTWLGGDVAVVLWCINHIWVLLGFAIALAAIVIRWRKVNRRGPSFAKRDASLEVV